MFHRLKKKKKKKKKKKTRKYRTIIKLFHCLKKRHENTGRSRIISLIEKATWKCCKAEKVFHCLKKKRQENIVTSWNYFFAWKRNMEILEVHELFHRLRKRQWKCYKSEKVFHCLKKQTNKQKRQYIVMLWDKSNWITEGQEAGTSRNYFNASCLKEKPISTPP